VDITSCYLRYQCHTISLTLGPGYTVIFSKQKLLSAITKHSPIPLSGQLDFSIHQGFPWRKTRPIYIKAPLTVRLRPNFETSRT
jgi:hypothetical protein